MPNKCRSEGSHGGKKCDENQEICTSVRLLRSFFVAEITFLIRRLFLR